LVHTAAAAFPRVALYAESSLRNADLALLPSAAAAVSRVERIGEWLAEESPTGVGLAWNGAAAVDGRAWPVFGDGVVWLPGGAHTVEPSAVKPGFRVVQLNADLLSARYVAESAIELAYVSQARAYLRLDRPPVRVEIDGQPLAPVLSGPTTLVLPRGQHLVTIRAQ
jgi:hypothetical protein